MSAPGPVTVLAHWQPREGALGEVLAMLAELRPTSLAEPGCLGYEVYHGPGAPASLLLLERYRDMEALAAHRESGHYRTLVTERILPLLAQRRVELLQARAAA
ncbi:putative quinol monooxygenase [Massilia niastensis]|uniref:putative quinol monooxygenase n=1 Tax=Massilia niastensis TaxID=544911 RepID=UPI000375A87D|nr:putative quinol monooxygenase [Massilia niastensis]